MKRALITGASSGIGMELARLLTARGYAVALLARRAGMLSQLAASLPDAVAIPCDVSDRDAVHAAVHEAVERLSGPLDLVIANAGIGLPTHAAKFNLDDAELMMRVNLMGTIYLFDAVVPAMIERRSGSFAGVASVAGLRGLPASGIYSATKAAMQTFLEASRIELAPYGVRVTIVNPGFVSTPMTEKNRFPMPFLMTAPEAAKRIADCIERGAREVEFPLPMSLLMRAVRLIPNAIYDRITTPYARRKIDEGLLKR